MIADPLSAAQHLAVRISSWRRRRQQLIARRPTDRQTRNAVKQTDDTRLEAIDTGENQRSKSKTETYGELLYAETHPFAMQSGTNDFGGESEDTQNRRILLK